MCYKYFINKCKKKRSISLIDEEFNNQTIDRECPICLDVLDNRDTIIILQCNHIFHEKCIDEHIKRGNDFCPYCMKKINKNSYILL